MALPGTAADLFQMIQRGDTNALSKLVALKPALADAKNQDGVSAILWALYHRQKACADSLVGAGAAIGLAEAVALGRLDVIDEHTRRERGAARGYSADGFPLLGYACFFGQLEAAALLLARGADPDLASTNPMRVAPLHSAAAADRADIAALLLAAHADPDVKQLGGFTPLHAAAQHGNFALARLLLAFGAHPRSKTEEGQGAIELAEAKGHKQLAAFLRSAPIPSAVPPRASGAKSARPKPPAG